MTKSLLLLDSSSDIRSILSDPSNFEDSRIISFDVESNLVLSELGIHHEQVENYIDVKDEDQIDKLALKMSLEWYKQKNFQDFLEYKDINLGWLLEHEFHPYLLQVMKNLVGLIKIIDKEKPNNISASNFIASFINSTNLKDKVLVQTFPKINSLEFYFDTVEIPINLPGKKINIKTSRNSALKIKKLIEQSTNLIFNLKHKNNLAEKKHILLLEFNPIQYYELLEQITSLDDKIIFLNERRPAVWNLESLRIVKKFNCKILRLSDINDKLQQKIELEKTNLVKKLNGLFLNDKDFEEYFSIGGFSFWYAIKENFMLICRQRLSEAVSRILSSIEFFENTKIHYILTMYNAGAEERAILAVAQKYKVPGILLQHGIYAQNQHLKKIGYATYIIPNLGLKKAVWGNESKQCFIDLGVSNDNLILSGSPRHDKFFKTKINEQKNNSILLATNVIVSQDYHGINSRVHENYQTQLYKIFQIANTIPDKKLIVKLHPAKPPIDVISKILDTIKPPLQVSKTGNIFDYIINSDVVISTQYSTVLIEAMILKKPTITFLFDHKDYENEMIIKNGATAYVQNLEEFSDVLNRILTNKIFRENLVQKGTEFINKYLTNQGNSSEFLANFLHGRKL